MANTERTTRTYNGLLAGSLEWNDRRAGHSGPNNMFNGIYAEQFLYEEMEIYRSGVGVPDYTQEALNRTGLVTHKKC